ncbi:MAG: hypothetical protein ABL921_24035 [Pirellula sp.]
MANCQEPYLRIPMKGVSENFDYGTLAIELNSNHPLQLALEITDEQAVGIETLCKSADLKRLERESSKLEFVADREIGDRQHSIDISQRRMLATVLTEQQITRLKKWAFYSRFRNNFRATLNEPFVLRFVGVESVVEWRQFVTDAELLHSKKLDAARDEAVRAILEEIPSYSKVLFAQYLGEKYFRSELVRADIDVSTVPFNVTSLSSGLISYVLHDHEFIRALRMDEGQLARINNLNNEHEEAQSKLLREKLGPREMNLQNLRNHKEVFGKMDNVLRAEQKLALARVVAFKQFEIDPIKAFENEALRKYLGYDANDEDWKGFDDALSKHAGFLHSEIERVNGLMLRAVAKSQSDARGRRLLYLFNGVWK